MPLPAVGPSVNHIGQVTLGEHFLDQKGNLASGSIQVNHNTFEVSFGENGKVNARFTSGNWFTNLFRGKTLSRLQGILQHQYDEWLSSKKDVCENGIREFNQKTQDMFKHNLDKKASHCADLIQQTYPANVKSLDKLKSCIKNLLDNMANTVFKTNVLDTEKNRVEEERRNINFFLKKGLSFLLHGDENFSDTILTKEPDRLKITLKLLILQLYNAENRQPGKVEINLAEANNAEVKIKLAEAIDTNGIIEV